jgi:hypothetical protein
MLTTLQAIRLNDATGQLSSFSKASIAGIVLTQELAGILDIVGVTDGEGAAQPWSIDSGSSGWVAAPGSGFLWTPNSFTFSDPADQGNAFAILAPI